MLDEVEARRGHRRVFRLAVADVDEDLLGELGLDASAVREIHAMLAAAGLSTSPEELCDAAFKTKRAYRRRTRFSDGSFPVFYSSLSADTAEAEVGYWLPKYLGRPTAPRTAYYERFSCSFVGTEKDLRGKSADWPELVADDYTFCNRLGADAWRRQLDGLVTPSARHSGSNQPVFRRRALSDPQPEGLVALTYDPTVGGIVSHRSIE